MSPFFLRLVFHGHMAGSLCPLTERVPLLPWLSSNLHGLVSLHRDLLCYTFILTLFNFRSSLDSMACSWWLRRQHAVPQLLFCCGLSMCVPIGQVNF